MPIGESDAPAGDFAAEYRGALERAESTAGAAVTRALAAKVSPQSFPLLCLVLIAQIATEDASSAGVLEAEERESGERDSRTYARETVAAAVEAAAAKVGRRPGGAPRLLSSFSGTPIMHDADFAPFDVRRWTAAACSSSRWSPRGARPKSASPSSTTPRATTSTWW